MPFLSLGRGFADEYEVSDFVMAVHDGDQTTIDKHIQKDSTWKTDWMALFVAMRLNRKDIFKQLLDSGINVPESIYRSVLFHDESFLPLLPHHPEYLKRAYVEKATSDLNHGIFLGNLSGAEVRALIQEGVDIHTPYFFSHAVTGQLPIQIAVRYPKLSVIKELHKAGANLRSMIDDKSISRLVIENDELSKEEIKEFHRFFKTHDAPYVPELSVFDRLRVWCGNSVSQA